MKLIDKKKKKLKQKMIEMKRINCYKNNIKMKKIQKKILKNQKTN